MGVYALFLAQLVGPTGKVLAFEPLHIARERLLSNIATNNLEQVIEVREEALGDASRAVGLTSVDGDPEGALGYVTYEQESTGLHVRMRRLDEFLYRNISFCKMDVEGFEMKVLAGAESYLGNAGVPVWQLELWGHGDKYGDTTTKIIGHMKEKGYACGVYKSVDNMLRITHEPWTIYGNEPNVLFVKEKELVNRCQGRLGDIRIEVEPN